MDDKEIHYLTYDPEAVWMDMILAYIGAGGDVLYPGDEKEIFLRGVQQMFVQAFAGIDNALRMDTLRYAVRNYLDLYGEKRNCARLKALPARSAVKITFRQTGIAKTLRAGTALTADGEVLFLLEEDIAQTGYAQVVDANIVCEQAGALGNGLLSGMQMQFLTPQSAVTSTLCTINASGGQDEEDDETYRERIRRFGLSTVTTGPTVQYESVAMDVTSEILDARAINLGAGNVGVYLLLASDDGADGILEAVDRRLNSVNTRPLTDHVTVARATAIPYTLNVQYVASAGSNITEAIAEAVKEYRTWQDETIGRAFNPDKLMAMLYQAGAMRVVWAEGSEFNGGAVEYSTIGESDHCSGNISLAVMNA